MTDSAVLEQLVELLEIEEQIDRAKQDPAYLMSFMSAPDERTGRVFNFDHLREPSVSEKWEALWPSPTADQVLQVEGRDWSWQRDFFLWLYNERRAITLKARQLGITWLACGCCVVDALLVRGSLDLIYRQKEEEAVENVRRCWALYQSLPQHLRMDAEVLKPTRGALPSTEIQLRFPDGHISRILAMTSASASGHGKTARRILMDEHSRIERADEITKAVQPAAGTEGIIDLVSTANGVSNEESGEGNRFHHSWVNADEIGYSKRFLPWSMHPGRDQHWYDTSEEVRGLKPHERAEQYPSTEDEAFALTKRLFFNVDDVMWYSKHRVREPLFRADFVKPDDRKILATGPAASLQKWKGEDRRAVGRVSLATGAIRVYVEPKETHRYGLAADVATGDGLDYCAAYVIDLQTAELVAELRQRYGGDVYAAQLHFLGRWYNTARLAVETQGGYGDAVISGLRDQTAGRPPYPAMYRHRLDAQPGMREQRRFGFPTNVATRPKILNQMERHLRERTLPFLTHTLLGEIRTFIEDDRRSPSPRAMTGSHDDCVMAAAIALELYRQYGDFEHKTRTGRRKTARPPVAYPWQTA